MQEMNYGCGTTVHPAELSANPTVLYVGVGGGLEALQFSYFSRRPGAVIAVDPVEAMRDAAARNLVQAAEENDWFDPVTSKFWPETPLNCPFLIIRWMSLPRIACLIFLNPKIYRSIARSLSGTQTRWTLDYERSNCHSSYSSAFASR